MPGAISPAKCQSVRPTIPDACSPLPNFRVPPPPWLPIPKARDAPWDGTVGKAGTLALQLPVECERKWHSAAAAAVRGRTACSKCAWTAPQRQMRRPSAHRGAAWPASTLLLLALKCFWADCQTVPCSWSCSCAKTTASCPPHLSVFRRQNKIFVAQGESPSPAVFPLMGTSQMIPLRLSRRRNRLLGFRQVLVRHGDHQDHRRQDHRAGQNRSQAKRLASEQPSQK